MITRIVVKASAIILLGAITLLKCSGNEHLIKAVRSTYMVGKTGPTIEDLDVFPKRTVLAGRERHLAKGIGKEFYTIDSHLIEKMEEYDPIALVVLQSNELNFEKFWGDFDHESLTNSFSVAKSIVGLSVLKCIDMGLIQGLDQKVLDFIPELDGEYAEELTIRHLLQMTSGINFDESYGDPLGFMAKAYYGDDLEDKTLSYEVEKEPGSEWEYLGGNTLLLSIIVNRVSGMTMSDFVSLHFWKNLGASQNAFWSLDEKDGMEKAYCCFYSSAHDFARIGLIVQNDGFIYNHRFISSRLIQELQKPVVLNHGDTVEYYGLHWWRMEYNGVMVHYARGILGQYIISIPEYDMSMVRLGKERGEKDEHNHPIDIYLYLELASSLHYQALGIKNFGAYAEFDSLTLKDLQVFDSL